MLESGPMGPTVRRTPVRPRASRSPGPAIYYGDFQSPVGRVWIARSSKGVFRISFSAPDEETFARELWTRASGAPTRGTGPAGSALVTRSASAVSELEKHLREYFTGKRKSFAFPVDLQGTTPFQRSVLRATGKIPYGKAVSYQKLASSIGKARATRAVGQALGSNPVPIIIPCHRVIAADGTLGGFTVGDSPYSTDIKRKLLILEKVKGVG